MIPKPKLPTLNLKDEIVEEEEKVEESEGEETPITKERVVKGLSKLLGFVSAIGLPKEVFVEKSQEYAILAEETGVTEALLDTIEYYFPDLELSPAIVLMITGVAFASAVISDRQQTLQKFAKKQETKSVGQVLKEQEEKLKSSVEVKKNE